MLKIKIMLIFAVRQRLGTMVWNVIVNRFPNPGLSDRVAKHGPLICKEGSVFHGKNGLEMYWLVIVMQ